MTTPVQGPTSPFDRTGPTDTPPPLPRPGTGGVEEVPGRADRAQVPGLPSPGGFPVPPGWTGCGTSGRGDLADSRRRVARAAALVGLLVAVWAVSGGGHFWPAWVMIGWGACLVPDITRLSEERRARGRAPS
ncbi:2TM domain-containing protein [Serinicoccus chungangensis]|uniref:2TM domain-containing protein n=1 Tax=Serinicoccus chungangensis TaxID=767452 RepID=UPI00111899FE|nr:2TM domain-containing protein [Serinicoccus chungangensis]